MASPRKTKKDTEEERAKCAKGAGQSEDEVCRMLVEGHPDAAASLMKPANEDVLVSRPVLKAVGNVKNNGPE